MGTEGDDGTPDGEDIGRGLALPCVEVSDSECEVVNDNKSELEDVPSEDERSQPALKTQRLCDERAFLLRNRCAARGTPPTTNEIDEVMQSWQGTRNVGRRKAAGPDVQSVESDSLGLVKQLN